MMSMSTGTLFCPLRLPSTSLRTDFSQRMNGAAWVCSSHAAGNTTPSTGPNHTLCCSGGPRVMANLATLLVLWASHRWLVEACCNTRQGHPDGHGSHVHQDCSAG